MGHMNTTLTLHHVQEIDTEISFTLMSEQSAQRAWRLWGMPESSTKDDALFMELFFKTLDIKVKFC